MTISAMKQALEALVEANEISKGAYAICLPAEIDTAMDVLRQAIEQAEKQEPVAFRNTETGEFCTGGFLRKDWAKWQPLYAAPVHARPVVHEVRCTYPQCQATNGCVGACSKTAPVHDSDISQEPVVKTAKDRHEFEEMVKKGTKAWADTPDDWVDELRGGIESRTKVGTNSGVLHKKWVGLTDEEVADYWVAAFNENGLYVQTFASLIETRLKEKNA